MPRNAKNRYLRIRIFEILFVIMNLQLSPFLKSKYVQSISIALRCRLHRNIFLRPTFRSFYALCNELITIYFLLIFCLENSFTFQPKKSVQIAINKETNVATISLSSKIVISLPSH